MQEIPLALARVLHKIPLRANVVPLYTKSRARKRTMHSNRDMKVVEPESHNDSEGLYHEAQADGVPYDEELEPFTKDLPKLDISRS